MKLLKPYFLILLLICLYTLNLQAQLSETRKSDIAEIKVARFQNILDLNPIQSTQLKEQTIIMLNAQSNVSGGKNISRQVNKNLDEYYASLTSLKPQQLATLKLMDSIDREGRKGTYSDLIKAYDQSSEFAISVASYNWNIVLPILVSYRKDLDRYISPADRATISEIRVKMIEKFNFINTVRIRKPSIETEIIISAIQDEILSDIQESALPRLLKKYDDRINNVRSDLAKYEKHINIDIKEIYDEHKLSDHMNQIDNEVEFLGMLGISKLLKASFFLLMDGDSRSASFKIKAVHLMSNRL